MAAASSTTTNGSSSPATATTPLPLRVRGPKGGPPKILNDLTTASTLDDLDCAIRIAFGIKEDVGLAFLAGFPPKPLGGDGGVEEDNMCLGTRLAANEMVTVREEDGSGPTVLQGTGVWRKSKGKKKAAAAAPLPLICGGGANIHTLPTVSSSSSSKRTSPGGSGGGGGGKRRRRINVGVSSEEDVGGLLLNAISGGGGRVGQCMRAVFRKSVEEQYNITKAEARLTAAQSGSYTIRESAAR